MTRLFALEEEELAVMSESSDDVITEIADTEDPSFGSDVVKYSEAVASGVDATNDLADVADVIQEASDSGEGLSPVAAEAIRISLRLIGKNLGSESVFNSVIVSTEAFGSSSSRIANTRNALEGVKDFLKETWATIVKFVRKMVKKVTDFIEQLFDKKKRLLAAIKSTENYVKDKYKSGKTNKDAMNVPGWAKAIKNKDGVLNSKYIIDVTDINLLVIKELPKSVAKNLATADLLSGLTPDQLAHMLGRHEISASGKPTGRKASDVLKADTNETTFTIPPSGSMFGALKYKITNLSVDGSDFETVKASLTTDGVINKEINKIIPLTPSDCKTIMSTLTELINSVDQNAVKDIKNTVKAMEKLVEDVPENEGDSANINLYVKFVKMGIEANTAGIKMYEGTIKSSYNLTQSSLKYIVASVKHNLNESLKDDK